MKGKLFIFFILALAALVVVAIIGRTTINASIESIRRASQPNEKRDVLENINQRLLLAEASIRTYTITGDPSQLRPFSETASTIDGQIDRLESLTSNPAQQALLREMERLIREKFNIYTALVQLKEQENDNSAMDQIMADIDALKDTSDGVEYEQLFGENQEQLMSDSLFESNEERDLNSRQLQEALADIRSEQQQSDARRRQQELQFTLQDYQVTQQIRALVSEFDAIDADTTVSQAENVADASENARLSITLITIITVLSFGILLYILFRDLSQNQRNREELRLAKIKAEQLAKAKEEFLANMSHEIRTPLNAVLGFSDQLAQEVTGAENIASARKIQKSGRHLLSLVNDILDSAKLESGKITLEHIAFQPHEEIRDTFELFETEAKRKSLQWNLVFDEELPRVLIGDPVRLRQILMNLLSNALKFTDSGGITLTVNADEQPDNKVRLHITVSDTGIGIPSDKLAVIFEDFSQADSSTTRKFGGTGLGLSIVKKLAELHEGTVTVESEQDKGTTFHVHVTMQAGNEQDLPATPEPLIQADLQDFNILVVDDQPFNLEVAANMLKDTGAAVTTADSGESASELLTSTTFDLILMDVQMPGLSGTELSRRIRNSDSPHRNVPILALTAGTSDKDKEEALASGMNDIILKPIQKHLLIEAISKYRNRISLDGLKDLGDDGFVIRMLNLFDENIRKDLAELQNAFDLKDDARIRALAHKMIPPCRHLGLEELVVTLKELESADYENKLNDLHHIETLVQAALHAVKLELDTITETD